MAIASTDIQYRLSDSAVSAISAAYLGDVPAGQSRAVWVRRTVNANAAAASDGFTINVTGDTAA
jgi:hypothetical protein